MKVKVYNLEGAVTGEIELADSIFAVKVKSEVVHEVIVAMENNLRQPWADTKSKGEVRGGGKKPWAQKGTGRARHGSIRSPIWKGGGVVFGPRTIRSYICKINKKKRRLALKMCLSDRVKNEALLVVENFDFKEAKTKLLVKFLQIFSLKQKTLFLTMGKDEQLTRMSRNLKTIETKRAEDVNAADILKRNKIVISKEGLEKLTKILAG